MKEEQLKIRNFKAKLPNDYVSMVDVIILPKEKTTSIVSGNINNMIVDGYKNIQTHDTLMCIPNSVEFAFRSVSPNEIMCRSYCIKEDEILFMGSYSNFFLFRWIQKLLERVMPEKVIIKYITAT